MIKPGALVMAAVMAAVSAGTFYGLGMLPPGTIPPPIGRVPPVEPHKIVQDITPASTAPAAAPAPAPAAAETPAAAPTEQELAEEPAPKQVAAAEQAPAATPAPAPEAKAEPAAAPQAKPEPAAEPVPTPAARPAPTPAASPSTTAAAEPAPASEAPKTRSTVDSDAMKQWWPEPGKLPANQLKLMYAGDVQGEAAIGLLFSEAPALDSLKLHAHVRDTSGADVPGTWEPGKNPRLVVFRGLKPGRYTVILEPALADAKGFALGQTLQGAVYIPAH